MMSNIMHPGLLLILTGLLLSFFNKTARTVVILIVPVLALIGIWTVDEGILLTTNYLGFELVLIKVDAVSRLFITVFALTVFTGSLYCCKQAKSLELASAFVYAGGAMSVVLAGDLITLFVFWEIMAIASTLLIWSART